ncbi:MAG: ClbS/DfsB family four-helix bundle protein [Vicinamibacterales bacterium]
MDAQLEAIESMPLPQTKAELMERISPARAALDRCVGSLSEAQLATAGPGGGWVKDHLTHIATWEEMLAAHLRCGSDHEVVGMDEATYERQDLDSLNAAVYEMHRHREVRDVLARFGDAHAAVLEQLDEGERKPFEPARVDGAPSLGVAVKQQRVNDKRIDPVTGPVPQSRFV